MNRMNKQNEGEEIGDEKRQCETTEEVKSRMLIRKDRKIEKKWRVNSAKRIGQVMLEKVRN